jgi:hypothetical protein
MASDKPGALQGVSSSCRHGVDSGCRLTRAAVEPVIGHAKDDHRMRGNYLRAQGDEGDRANAVLAAAGYNFSQVVGTLERLLRALLLTLFHAIRPAAPNRRGGSVLHLRLNPMNPEIYGEA